MSKVTIQGDANGTGIFTIASPNSNTDRTLVLPDEAGTIDTQQRAGNVLQVVNFVTADQGSVVAALGALNTALSPDIYKTITPIGNGSKFLIQVRWNGEMAYTAQWQSGWNILRDGVRINSSGNDTWDSLQSPTFNYPGSDNDSTGEGMTTFTLDTTGSTAGTPITYRLALSNNWTVAFAIYTNRTFDNTYASGAIGYENWSSEMIITEIAG